MVIDCRSVSNLLYADHTTPIAKNDQRMSELIDRVEQESLRFRLKLNRKKTKLIVNRTDKIGTAPNIPDVENVQEMVYLIFVETMMSMRQRTS